MQDPTTEEVDLAVVTMKVQTQFPIEAPHFETQFPIQHSKSKVKNKQNYIKLMKL